MANDLAEMQSASVPDFLRKRSTGAPFGNLDADDLRPPRLKILAGQSPEITGGAPGAMVGHFWLTILNQNLGLEVVGSPIAISKKYHVWAPLGSDQKGPLATSTDGIKWDAPNQTFEVKFPLNPQIYKWRIGRLVTDFGAHQFGTQRPEDPMSKPIAGKTFDVLWLIDLPNGRKQLCVFTNKSTGIKPTENWSTLVKTYITDGCDHYFQRYRIVSKKLIGPTKDPYFSYEYQWAGTIASDAEADYNRRLFQQYGPSWAKEAVADTDEPFEVDRSAPKSHDHDDDDVPF